MKPLVYASAFLLLGFCSCEEEQPDQYYIRAKINLEDWKANEFDAEQNGGDVKIMAFSDDYIFEMLIRDVGKPNQFFRPKIIFPQEENDKFEVVESAFTLLGLDTVSKEITASFRFVARQQSTFWSASGLHIEFGELHIPFQFIPLPPVYCEVAFVYDSLVNERFGRWRLIHVDEEGRVHWPPCDYEVRLELTEHDEWVQSHYMGFTGGITVDTDCNISAYGFRMMNDSTLETTDQFWNSGIGCSDVVQDYEARITNTLHRDTLQITYDHNLLFLENQQGTRLHFYYDPE